MKTLNNFIEFIKSHDGIGNKEKLTGLSVKQFDLTKDRSVYYCKSFTVRFSLSISGNFSNTVVSLSKLKKYDDIPFLVCLVTKTENRIYLANTTFLTKISHSSQKLTLDNIRGSFNGADIINEFEGFINNRDNIKKLYAIHSKIGFEGNLTRLVEATTNIIPTGIRFEIGETEKKIIKGSIKRANEFCLLPEFNILKNELDKKVKQYKDEIHIVKKIKSDNNRGKIIEYLIAGDDEKLKTQLVRDIKADCDKLTPFKTKNTLGDYVRVFDNFNAVIDIKSKIISSKKNSSPKGYDINKFLELHSKAKNVLLFYFIGIDEDKKIIHTNLISVYQKDLLNVTGTQILWSGRNGRGTAQFEGTTIKKLLDNPSNVIDEKKAKKFIQELFKL